VAGVSHLRQSNQQALVAGGDYATRSGEVGIRYAFKSGSAIVIATRLNNGTYLNRVVPNTALLDDSFKQLDNEARLRWDLGGGSVVDANLTHINRTHPLYAQRDFSGFNTGAYLSLRLTGKSAFTAGYSHELAEYGASNSNYTQTDRISLGPVWQVSPKVTLRLNQKWSQIAYLGSPTEGLSNNRSDFTRDTAITLSWQPLKQLGLSTSFQNIARSTNVANLDYDSNQLNFSAQLNY
jgi:hypothetical protein